MTPFLIATLLALLITGVLYQAWRQGDRRGFRRALGSAALFITLLVVYAVWFSGGELARTDAGQVVLGELQLAEAAGSFRVTGVASNRAGDRTLTSLPLQLRVQDCAADDTCRTVYEGWREVLVTIPPGGSAAFTATWVAEGDIRIRGERRWFVVPGDPRAEKP